jgi:hypothetical protein
VTDGSSHQAVIGDVRLTWRELSIAAGAGVTRRIRSLADGRTERFDPRYGDSWGREINGAAAELALAKLRGVYWGGHVDTFRAPDVGGRWQVRQTDRPDGCLIAHPEDVDDDVLVLVTGRDAAFNVRGYLRTRDAKQQRWWRTDVPHPAFFIPQSELEA